MMNPEAMRDYLISQGRIPKDLLLSEALISLQPAPAYRFLQSRGIDHKKAHSIAAMKAVSPIERIPHFVLVWNIGVGAPQVISNLELLWALGVRRFIFLGMVGGLDERAQLGEVKCIQKALVDEGTSLAYGENLGSVSEPKFEVSSLLAKHAFKERVESVQAWTTDAPLRGDLGRLNRALGLGCQVVDMESSAVFSWANTREVEVAYFGVVSDTLKGQEWVPGFHLPQVNEAYDSALAQLLKVNALASFAR